MSEPELLGARRLRELLDRHGVRPSRQLGQNFVIDPNTIRKMVALAGVSREDSVLEIGAGAGSLTVALAAAAASVVAVEIDDRLVAVLRDVLAGVANVEVVPGDAGELDLGGFGATLVVANLPYGSAARIVLRVLAEAPRVAALTVMCQKEVGDRLAAAPGSKLYGRTSVLAAVHGVAEVAAPVSRRAFYPEPNVDSVVVRIRRRPPPDVDLARLGRIVAAAFSQRRKTLRRALAGVLAERDIVAAGVDPGGRAEQLGLDAFVALARSQSGGGQ